MCNLGLNMYIKTILKQVAEHKGLVEYYLWYFKGDLLIYKQILTKLLLWLVPYAYLYSKFAAVGLMQIVIWNQIQ